MQRMMPSLRLALQTIRVVVAKAEKEADSENGEGEGDDSDEVDDPCQDCTKSLGEGKWKGLNVHSACGSLRNRLSAILQDQPELRKVLIDARKTDPATYRVLVKELESQPRGKHITPHSEAGHHVQGE